MNNKEITGNEVFIHQALINRNILRGFTNADELLGRTKTVKSDFITKAELFEPGEEISDEEVLKAFTPDEIGLDPVMNRFYPDGTKHKFEEVDYIKKGNNWFDFEKANLYMSGSVISHPDQPGAKYQKEGNDWKHLESSEKLKEGIMHIGTHETHPVHGLPKGTTVKYKYNGADDTGIIGSHKKEPSGLEYANIHHKEEDGSIGKKKIGLEYTKIYKNDEKGQPTSEFYAAPKRRTSTGGAKQKFDSPQEAAVHNLAGHVKTTRDAMASYPEDSKEYKQHSDKLKNLVNTMHTTNVYAGGKSEEDSSKHIAEKTGMNHAAVKKLLGIGGEPKKAENE